MYYIIFIIGLFLSVINDKRKVCLSIFTGILIVFASLRYGLGTDYFAYLYLYERLNYSLITELFYGLDRQEVGFRLIGSFLKNLGFSYQYYLILISIINIYFISKTCSKYSKNPIFSLLLYFCFYYLVWTFGGLRQGITLAIGVYYLLEAVNNKKSIKLVIITLLLSLIHSSAIILIILYLVSKIDLKKKTLIILSAMSILASVIPLGNIINRFTFMPYYQSISPYLDTDISLNLFDFQGLGRLFFLMISLYFYDIYSRQSSFDKKVINIYIISLLFYFLFQFSELTASRISMYGKILDILILVNLIYIIKSNLNRLIYIYLIVALCFSYITKDLIALQKNFDQSNSIIAPYTNIFNKDDYIFINRTKYTPD